MTIQQLLYGFIQVTVGQNSAVPAVDLPTATPEAKMNLWEMTLSGGVIMIPIFLLSLVAVYIFVDRYINIQKATKEDANFMAEIKNYILQGKINEARAHCKANPTIVSLMIDKGISRIGKPLGDVREAIENVGQIEVSKLERHLPTLATASGAAPMLGFLGTVQGMIVAFFDMANAGGNINMTILSSGIYTAMVTTVAGLTVGIFAYFCYNILTARINTVVNKLQLRATEFMDLLNEPTE